ncbi:PIN domain-containing protein [Streptomyces rubiginosohelvolus]|uniref:PIN domain-containing protein n=1 Tax=Streptomyces rubiginosohelvolus TaxID=67362 RepID=UPI003667888C
MRLNPGVTLERADQVLRRAENTWSNARSMQNEWEGYTTAVHDTYNMLKQTFATPDFGPSLLSPVYWNLLGLGHQTLGVFTDPLQAEAQMRNYRARTMAIRTEIENQFTAMEQARVELEALKELGERPGLPIVYDTNMLLHWQQAGDIKWREVLKEQGETELVTRLVVPLTVLDELDRQKYGQGELGKKAATVIRYLDRTLKDAAPGAPVELRSGVTLEVWLDTDERGEDADLSILRCAADLDGLHPTTGARVLTGDIGMRLRAGQMRLKTVRLPEAHRKKGTALDIGAGADGLPSGSPGSS